MGAFLRQMVDTHTEMTAFLLSLATRGADRRRLRPHHRSDGEVVMSDLATTISDLSTASARVIKRRESQANAFAVKALSFGTLLTSLATVGGGIYLAALGHIWGAGIVIAGPLITVVLGRSKSQEG